MTTPARRRLMKNVKRLQEDHPYGVSGAPTENNIMLWQAVIFGPADTPFEDGIFQLTLEFSEEYPYKPPVIKFSPKCFNQMYMRMEASASTFYKINETQHMMCLPYSFLES